MPDIVFQYPQAFWLFAALPVLALLYLLYRRWHGAVEKRLGEPALVAPLLNRYKGRNGMRFAIFLFAFALGVVALANPRSAGETEPDVRQGIDLVFAVDVSNSMRAADVQPNRLKAAAKLMQTVVENRPDDRLGLVVFAGHAYLQLPLTYDHSAAGMMLETLDPAMVPVQGTAINAALKTATEAFGKENKRYKVVVLLTDGETHDDQALVQVQELAHQGIQLHAIGFGSAGGAAIIDPVTRSPKLDASGTPVISKLNEPLLQQLASSARGKYFSGNDPAAAGEALIKQLAQVKQTAGIDPAFLTWKSWYAWLVIPMILLLLLEMFLPQRKKLAL